MYAKEQRVPPSRNSRLARIGRTGREGTAIFIPSSLLRSVDLLCTRTRAYYTGCTCRMNSAWRGHVCTPLCAPCISLFLSLSLLFPSLSLCSRRGEKRHSFGLNKSVSLGPHLCLSPRSLPLSPFSISLHRSLALCFSISSFIVLLHLIS